MLFFFEAGFFVLAILALVVAEVWGPGAALLLWVVVTVGSLLSGGVTRSRASRRQPVDRLDEQWWRALGEGWRHLDRLLLLGLLALGGWWLVGRALGAGR